MKKTIIIFLGMVSALGFAQKKELKKAEKLFASGDTTGANAMLNDNASLFDAADEKTTGILPVFTRKNRPSHSGLPDGYGFIYRPKG